MGNFAIADVATVNAGLTTVTSSIRAKNPDAPDVLDFPDEYISAINNIASGSIVEMGTITFGTTWSGNDPYTQTVTVVGATVSANSKVDLQPDSTVISQMIDDGIIALYITNTNGVLTATAMGGSFSTSVTVQCTIETIGNSTNVSTAVIGDEYTSKAYSKGELCMHNGVLYKANQDIDSAEAWTPGHWTATNIADELLAWDSVQ